jgi:hypothetical protein
MSRSAHLSSSFADRKLGEVMLVPQRLSRKLREVFGPEAGEDLVMLLDDLRTQRSELAEFRREILSAIDRLAQQVHGVEVRLGDVKADLMKWSFVFWVGAVAAIAALAGVLR